MIHKRSKCNNLIATAGVLELAELESGPAAEEVVYLTRFNVIWESRDKQCIDASFRIPGGGGGDGRDGAEPVVFGRKIRRLWIVRIIPEWWRVSHSQTPSPVLWNTHSWRHYWGVVFTIQFVLF